MTVPIWDVRVLPDEESCISPTLAMFFEGCNLGCRFCMAYEHTRTALPDYNFKGLALELRSLFALAGRLPVRTVSLLGGEPSLYLAEAAEAYRQVGDEGVPVPSIVLNSNMMLRPEDLGTCRDFVSWYIADLKFGNDLCARDLCTSDPSASRGYWSMVTAAISAASHLGNVIIRHLPLPGHTDCCTRPILEWVARELPRVPVHLLGYYPNGRSGVHSIERTLSREERLEVMRMAGHLSLSLVSSAFEEQQRGTTASQDEPSAPPATDTRDELLPSPSVVIVARDGSILFPDLPAELRPLVRVLGHRL